ncbi:MAG: histone deacetylase [Candidatus Puniceispirillaceae bacterium]
MPVLVAMLSLVTHPAYDIPLPDGHRFPSTKFSRLISRLEGDGIAGAFIRFQPDPAGRTDLWSTQSAAYVDAVAAGTLDAGALRVLGLTWSQVLANRSFLAVNGTLLAARQALRHGLACHAAGGTHHAHFGHGAGYCVFNDLAYSAVRLVDEGTVRRVLILDCDVHQGDGTARILAGRPDLFTCSLHCKANYPARKADSDLDIEIDRHAGDAAYLDILDDTLRRLRAMITPDLVLYDAGVDIHEGDRLGLLSVSYDGIRQRDAMVLRHFRSRGIPVATVIGGGYGTDLDEVAYRHSLVFHAAAAEYANG